jgi:hypothetical protein
MFDELHDPDPPTPGLHEFAAVAERAQQIRQRRNTWIARAASLVVVAGAAFAWSQLSDRTALAPTAPATSRAATTVPVTTVGSTTMPLPEAIGSTLLPAIGLGPGLLTVNRDPIVELFEDTDGRVCTQIDSVVVADSCAPAGTGFYASAWSGGQVIAVDPTVDASVDAAGAGCSQQFPDFAVVQVWICSDVDLDAATVEFVGERTVVVRADDG